MASRMWVCDSCGNVSCVSYSNKVHLATESMLILYPLNELMQYAKDLGLEPGKTKAEVIAGLVLSGKATICGSLGN